MRKNHRHVMINHEIVLLVLLLVPKAMMRFGAFVMKGTEMQSTFPEGTPNVHSRVMQSAEAPKSNQETSAPVTPSPESAAVTHIVDPAPQAAATARARLRCRICPASAWTISITRKMDFGNKHRGPWGDIRHGLEGSVVDELHCHALCSEQASASLQGDSRH